MEISVTVKNVFGNDTVYPACDTAQLLTKLTGRKTFTPNDLYVIRQLGYTVNVRQHDARPEWIYGK